MNYPHEIHYKNIRSLYYIRINRQGVVVFSIQKKQQGNNKLLNEAIARGEELYKKYNKKPKIESTNKDGVLIFGERVEWSDFFDNGKEYSEATKEKRLKEILYEYSIERIERFSNQLGIPYKSLTIRKMKARRGSCSSKQDIVLNLQLVHLPQKYIQYVCAHECAHLKEKNHSERFRAVVEGLFPNCKKIRKEMRSFILK